MSKKVVLKDALNNSQRLDKWLWTARFYKTRRLAAEAVNAGKVRVEGRRIKPSKSIYIGANLHIRQDKFNYEVVVQGLNKQRRPAKEAILLYMEDEDSKRKREALITQMQEISINNPMLHSDSKPNKKQRRAIIKFRQDG